MRKFNFSSGPSVLPLPVLQQAAAGLLELEHHGVSVAEISHRSHLFTDLLNELISLFRELLHLGPEHEVIILQGGARLQFAQIPMNFLKPSETAGFIDTGYWAHKAMEYAACYGQVITIGSSADQGYHIIPEISDLPHQLTYVQLTTNNTIYGTQYQELPKMAVPLIADMSSDLLSMTRDFSAIDFAFACAQKNVGPAGVSVAIVNRSFLEKAHDQLPPVFSYKNLVAHHSNYATPPVVNVYMSLLNLRWLKGLGGVAAVEKINEEKAALLYKEIERNRLFNCPVVPAHRSRMNVCFFAKEKNTELAFLDFCHEKNIVGIEGHKAAGGLRASIYNAQSLENVAYLAKVMQQFEQQHASTVYY